MAEAVPSEIEHLEPDSLEAHPLNDDVYGDRTDPDEALLQSIEDHGIVEPIVADPNQKREKLRIGQPSSLVIGVLRPPRMSDWNKSLFGSYG